MQETVVVTQPPQKRTRRPRRDKGTVIVTARDQVILQWIAEQYTVRFDQLQHLIARCTPERESDIPATISGTRYLLSRWQKAGWVATQRVLAGEGAYIYLTPRGLRALFHGSFRVWFPTPSLVSHMAAVNSVRLAVESREGLFTWVSERTLRRHQQSPTTHIADALIETADGTIAIEVERTSKSIDEIERIMQELLDTYSRVWYFVTEGVRPRVERARSLLSEREANAITISGLAGLA